MVVDERLRKPATRRKKSARSMPDRYLNWVKM